MEKILRRLLVLTAGAGIVLSAQTARAESVETSFQAACAAVSERKPAGVKRVFILGGAEAVLLGTPGKFQGLEVINCGKNGYGAAEVAGLVPGILKYQPDLLVVLSGGSGRRREPARGFSFSWLRSKYYARRYGRWFALLKTELKAQQARLESAAAAARSAKVPVLFCTLPANLELPPSGAPPAEKAAFADGMVSLLRGDLREAAENFRKGMQEGGADPYSRFYLARAQAGLKLFGEARENYLLALEEDLGRDRTPPSVNALIKEAASARGAGLCNLERAFYRVSANGLPGLWQFSGGALWRRGYNGFVWGEIAAAAGAMGTDALKGVGASRPEENVGNKELEEGGAGLPVKLAPVVWAANAALNERILSEMIFIESRKPGLLEKAALSPGLAAEALYTRVLILLELGRREEAAESLRFAAGSALAGWVNLTGALAKLEELEKN